jgi:hypothetical protein
MLLNYQPNGIQENHSIQYGDTPPGELPDKNLSEEKAGRWGRRIYNLSATRVAGTGVAERMQESR